MSLQKVILNLSTDLLCPIEEARLERLLSFERAARLRGFNYLAGVDEAGRGCLAGPVVAAACILPNGLLVPGLNDSKQLSLPTREKIFAAMSAHPDIHIGIGIVEPSVIDDINIYQASIKAMQLAVSNLPFQPDYLLVDGLMLPNSVGEKIIKGDTLSLSIAGASVAAKVTRDRLMLAWHEKYPQYSFHQHKGYATEIHRTALKKYGPCPIHRFSYAPVKLASQLDLQQTFSF